MAFSVQILPSLQPEQSGSPSHALGGSPGLKAGAASRPPPPAQGSQATPSLGRSRAAPLGQGMRLCSHPALTLPHSPRDQGPPSLTCALSPHL